MKFFKFSCLELIYIYKVLGGFNSVRLGRGGDSFFRKEVRGDNFGE